MRPIGIGLAVALMLAAFSPAVVMAPAFAASKPAKTTIDPEAHKKGMAVAADLVSGSGIDCQVADARLIGENTDPKTKVKTSFVELACANAEGFVVSKTSAGAYSAFSCIETAEPLPDGKPNTLLCMLPGNADPKAGLSPIMARTGFDCAIDKVRPIGHTTVNVYYEIACANGAGYVLQTSSPPRADKPVEATPCAAYPAENNLSCKLSDRATQLAVADKLMASFGKPCTVKDRRFVGMSPKHEVLYEVSCQEGKGYVLVQAQNGSLAQGVDCVNSDLCELTDARTAKTEQAALYTSLAKKAGFNCDVSKYAPFPPNAQNQDVVELVCSNRPDGAVGVFGTKPGDTTIYDCAHSELARYRCSLTDAAASYPKLTEELKSLGKGSCVVSKARTVGVTADTPPRGFIEVACADGLQGFMIEYSVNPITPKTTVVCSQAGGIAGGCKLPGNTGKS